MRNKLIILLAVLCLCGCTSSTFSATTIRDIEKNASNNESLIANHNIKYFSYYLPSDMSLIEYSDDSVILNYDDSNIIMDLNASGIVSSRYYDSDLSLEDEGLFDESKNIYSHSGEFTSSSNESKDYILDIYDYDSYYYVHLLTTDINYYAYAYDFNVNELVRHLFMLCKSANTNEDQVLADYSAKTEITYSRKQLNLFEYIIPNEGSIEDLIIE